MKTTTETEPHEGLALIGPSDLAFWWFSSLFLAQPAAGGNDRLGAAAESARVLSRDALGLRALAEAFSAADDGEADESAERHVGLRAGRWILAPAMDRLSMVS